MTRPTLIAALLLALAPAARADKKADGFVPMFNGKDLTGWVNVNCAPSTFFVKDGEIITTGKPTGYLRTARQYENFVAEFDWMHVPDRPGAVGNSGFFVWADPLPAVGTGYTRGIEVQVLVNLTYRNNKGEITATSQGDLFSIHGATCVPDRPHPAGWARCLPSENHAKGEREWNHYRVEANDGVIKLAVNGHVVSGLSKCNPRKGYLALEAEGSECHFKNLKIKELPSTNPRPEETANVDEGFVSRFNGLDLAGWKADAGQKTHWTPHDGMLRYDGKGEPKERTLWSDKEYGDFELIADWRFPAKTVAGNPPLRSCGVVLRGLDGCMLSVSPNGSINFHGGTAGRDATPGDVTGKTLEGMKPAGQWNRFRIRLEGDRLTADLNGKPVVENQQLSRMPAKGPIGLTALDVPAEFRSVFIRELKK
jgi:hypothetical protein